MPINTLERRTVCPQFGSRKPRNNSEITTAEQRDNSTGTAIKRQQRGRNIPALGWTSLKCYPILLRSYGASLAQAGERRSGLQCAPLVSQRSGFVNLKMRKSEER